MRKILLKQNYDKGVRLIIIMLLFSKPYLMSQQTYNIYDFSDKYGLLYTTSDTTSHTAKAYFSLYNKNTKKILFEDGDAEMKNNENKESTVSISKSKLNPYRIGFTNDYNFDKIADLYILGTEVIDEGCYFPNVSRILYISSNDQFEYSRSLTDLYAESTCLRGGFLDPDSINKRLISGSSGGYAYHEYNFYKWNKDKIKLVETNIEDGRDNPLYIQIKGKRLDDNSTWMNYNYKYLNTYTCETFFSFETSNGKGRLVLFTFDSNLYYAFEQGDDKKIYFAYPNHPDKAAKDLFVYSSNENKNKYQLSFNSGTVKYEIDSELSVNDKQNAMITITVNGKTSIWNARIETIKGSLSDLSSMNLKNIIYRD